MFTAYEIVFAPPSSHGARSRTSAARPSDAVATVMPSRRARTTDGPIAVTVANTVTSLPASAPRVHTTRAAPSTSAGQSASSWSINSARASAGGNARSSRAAEPDIRRRCSSQHPRPTSADVQRLEYAVAAQGAEIVRAEDGRVGRNQATTEHGDQPVGHGDVGTGTRAAWRTRSDTRRAYRPDVGSSGARLILGRRAAQAWAATDAPTSARPGGCLRARPRHAGPGAREGRGDRGRGQHHHRLPDVWSCSRSWAWSPTPTCRTVRRPITESPGNNTSTSCVVVVMRLTRCPRPC